MDVSGSHTAKLVALARAIGSKESDLKIRNPDTLAAGFLDRSWRLALMPGFRQLVIKFYDRLSPGMYLYHQARTHHFDQLLLQNLETRAPAQVVILGAGLDSRAYRLAQQLTGTKVFEVDHPGTAAHKRDRLKSWQGPRDHVTYVPVDFTADSLEERLREHGFDFDKPSYFHWEGVIYYLPEDAIHNTLAVLAKAAPGSSLSFDYVLKESLEHPERYFGAQGFIDLVERKGEPLRFGLDRQHLDDFLRPYGYETQSDWDADQLERAYLQMSNGKLRGKLCDVFSIANALRT